ncbi:MAG: O-antigen ligase family protein [Candidatus Paceibacterota bacterium]|jgi:hypothetical protein
MTKIIKICLLALAFAPLIFDLNVFFPYISSKSLFIQFFLLLATLLFAGYFIYSRSFRQEISDKISIHLKHPLVLSILSFILVFAVSAIFAVDKYGAFWGNIERAEGLANTMFFFVFFILSLLVFKKKDWVWFLKLSLLTTLILLGKEFFEFFNGVPRPGSFAGNPTFLAGYLLFSITASIIVFRESIPLEITRVRSGRLSLMGWKSLSVIVVIFSVLGIFIAQTRGTILGLAFGVLGSLIYCVFRGKNIVYKGLNLRKISAGILFFFVLFSIIFILTRENDIWQKVPGLSKVALININNIEDGSMKDRLLAYKPSIEAVNPTQNGWKKFLIGWGPDNFILAYGEYFSPAQAQHDSTWLDRAHNQLLDVLVMSGLLGLLAYLSIWFLFFRSILNRKTDFSLINMGFLLFGISFFVHLLFVFEQTTSSIAFFTVLAFAVYSTTDDVSKESRNDSKKSKTSGRGTLIMGSFFVFSTFFLCFIFFRNTLPSYFQMRNYFSIIKNPSPTTFESIDSVFFPFTTAQMDIRENFLKWVGDNYYKIDAKIAKPLFEKALIRAEEYIAKRPQNFLFLASLADVYTNKGDSLKSIAYVEKGEEYFRQMLLFAPNKSDINYGLAINLAYQKKFEESFSFFEKVFFMNPKFFSQHRKVAESIYTNFIKYFYEKRDKKNFLRTVERLKKNNYTNSAPLDKILEYLEKNNTWPRVDFE